MVDRYKKSGGFLQLMQVIETCSVKKREQFMNIITEENPLWADALNQKCLTFDKILSWKAETLLEIVASVNLLSFSTAIKGLSKEQLNDFLSKFSHQDKRKLESTLDDINPSANEILSSQMKVISETRILLNQGAIKADKIDISLIIPDDFEAQLEKSQAGNISLNNFSNMNGAESSFQSVNGSNSADLEKLQKKLILLSKEVQNLKQENLVMKDKLEKIKKIA